VANTYLVTYTDTEEVSKRAILKTDNNLTPRDYRFIRLVDNNHLTFAKKWPNRNHIHVTDVNKIT